MAPSRFGRALALAFASLTISGCIRLPSPPPALRILGDVTARVRVDVRVEADAPPAPRPELVPLRDAPVVEFFGIPLEGASEVVFVLDRSGSMLGSAQGALAPPAIDRAATTTDSATDPPRGRKIDVAVDELIDALARLPDGTRVNLIFFDDQVEGFRPRLVSIDPATRARLEAFVAKITPSGSTALTPAMRVAFMMDAERIVLLSDGLGNVGGGSDMLLRDAREAMRGGVRIDTIGLGSDHDRSLLQSLAAESGGLYQSF